MSEGKKAEVPKCPGCDIELDGHLFEKNEFVGDDRAWFTCWVCDPDEGEVWDLHTVENGVKWT